jgi:hypothetical protein
MYGEDSSQYRDVLLTINEQQDVIKRWQGKVNSGEEKPYAPDYSGTLQSQVQATAAHDKKAIDEMSHWWEKNEKEKNGNG